MTKMGINARIRHKVVGVIVLVLLLAACGGPGRLETLQLDPMATPTLEFGELIRSNEAEGNGDPFLGQPTAAIITTTFLVDLDREVEAIEELASQARQAGWELELLAPSSLPGYRGTKILDGLESSIAIVSTSRSGVDGFDPETAIVWVDLTTQDSHP